MKNQTNLKKQEQNLKKGEFKYIILRAIKSSIIIIALFMLLFTFINQNTVCTITTYEGTAIITRNNLEQYVPTTSKLWGFKKEYNLTSWLEIPTNDIYCKVDIQKNRKVNIIE